MEAVGVDLYNQTTTGGVSKTLNSIRSDADHVPVVLVFDARGNGGGQHMPDDNRESPRPSDGLHRSCFTEVRFFKWKPDEVSVSLRNKSGSYGGGSEVLIVQEPIVFRDDVTIKVGGGTAFSIDTMHRMQCVMQRVTGTLNQGAHPGSYNGQDAYNDMLVVDDGILSTGTGEVQGNRAGIRAEDAGPQGCHGSDYRGGVIS